ncbi:endonuclease/exonuclease/phosphatase family protein [Microbacterium sp. cf332]|uniref:endonuclease/exonuclease/phosphatase family protein n=1 Tax=Microbacterium sp. cf332 TaxID=1761804 RepID=UPI000884A163|nr:endonuclease/exonuclease/phosphatase family protein [Microbacterium sp. cf332]SDQ23009.1 Metal-dependent hydrolase, endonuclease/exonuclease/phosphatase family [Microbacterium sp. cf332]
MTVRGGSTIVSPLFEPAGVDPRDLHVATWNIRRRIDGRTWPPNDRWKVRAPRLAAVLRADPPAILGTQEAMPDQAALVRDALGASYRSVGRGRDADGSGEGCPVFFDGDRVELVGHAQLALSETPAVAGSSSWGNPVPRIAVRAVFRDRTTGATVTVINTHLDVFSARSRLRSAWLLRDLAADAPGTVLVMGDMNAGPGSAPLAALFSGDLIDAWHAAEERTTALWDTYGGYHPRRIRKGPIDWIAVDRAARVTRAAVDTRTVGGAAPSDHFGVHVLLRLDEETS